MYISFNQISERGCYLRRKGIKQWLSLNLMSARGAKYREYAGQMFFQRESWRISRKIEEAKVCTFNSIRVLCENKYDWRQISNVRQIKAKVTEG